jgi:hypothetical protein
LARYPRNIGIRSGHFRHAHLMSQVESANETAFFAGRHQSQILLLRFWAGMLDFYG